MATKSSAANALEQNPDFFRSAGRVKDKDSPVLLSCNPGSAAFVRPGSRNSSERSYTSRDVRSADSVLGSIKSAFIYFQTIVV